jgi:hypothetical protein
MLLGCGTPNSILVQVSNEPQGTALLSVQAILQGKTAMSAMDITQPLDRFGVSLPPDATGLLSLNVLALDSDRCTIGSAMPEIQLPAQAVNPPLQAMMTPVKPRKCAPLSACAQGMVCPYSPLPSGSLAWKGMWAAAQNNIWVVGWNGAMMHYDGAVWSSMSSGVPDDLNAIWGSSPQDIWAVGIDGAIHYDGTRWKPVTITGLTYTLNGVFGVSSTDVWAVGATNAVSPGPGEFWHFDGTSWKKVGNSTNGALLGVWASSPTDVYASGSAGLMLHYNGNSVLPMSTPTPYDLASVWGTAPNQIFAVGQSATILKYDGTSWKNIPISSGSPNYLNAVFGSGGTYYAVGVSGTVLRSSPALDSFQPYATGPSQTLWTGQLLPNGIAWVGGASEYLGYFDTRP